MPCGRCAFLTEYRVVANEQPPQAVILIPRNKLHHLLGSGADKEAIMSLVINDPKNHPSDASVRVDMLELMNKVLDFRPGRLTGFPILETAWNLKEMPLYHKALRHCTSGGFIPEELPKLLAALVTKSPSPQEMNWSEWSEIARLLHVSACPYRA